MTITTKATNRTYTQADIDKCIQKAAKDCARELSDFTAQSLIENLKNGGSCHVNPTGNSFSERGSAQSLSRRMQSLKNALRGNPSKQWLKYWSEK